MNQNEVKRRRIQVFAYIVALAAVLNMGRMAGENGVTYMTAAVLAFGCLWTLIGGGTADTLGRLLRIRNSKGQYKNADKMKRSILTFQMTSGLLGTLVLLFGAEIIGGKIFHMHYVVFPLMLLAPAFVFRAVSAVLMGFCQGEGSELPTAAACLLRQIFILVFSMIFCGALGKYGEKVSNLLGQQNYTSMYIAAGAAIAVSVSEVLVVVFLIVIQKVNRRTGRREQPEGMRSMDSFFDAVRVFGGSRAPMLFIMLLLFLPVVLGFLFFGKSMANQDAGAVHYGVYMGRYLVVCGLFVFIAAILFIGIYGRAAVSLRKEEQRFARVIFQSGVHITTIHTLFYSALLAVLAAQAAKLFGGSNAVLAEKLFRGGSLLIPFVALALYFGRFLMLTGKKFLVIGALCVGDVLYVVSMTLFLNVWKAGILSLVYVGILGSAVCCVLLGMIIYGQLRIGELLRTFAVPAGAACVSGLAGLLLCKLISPHLGNVVTALLCIIIMEVIYWAVLLISRNIKDQELECIPGGRIIAAFGQMLHVY